MKPSLVLLTHNSIYAFALARHLTKEGFSLPLIVVEGSEATKDTLKGWLLRTLGLDAYSRLSLSLSSSDQKLLALRESKLQQEARNWFFEQLGGQAQGFPEGSNCIFTERVNHLNLDIFSQHKEAVFLVFGTSILSREVIECSGPGFLNFHTSLLPHYKGTFPEFWQVYNNDSQQYGFTIHLVDPGVDTGPILMQQAIDYVGSNPYQLRALNTLEYFKILPSVVQDFYENKLVPRPQKQEAVKTYKYSDITLQHKRELFLR